MAGMLHRKGQYTPPHIEITCVWCGKTFLSNYSKAKYCGHGCNRQFAANAKAIKRNNPQVTIGKQCKKCGKHGQTTNFCSYHCKTWYKPEYKQTRTPNPEREKLKRLKQEHSKMLKEIKGERLKNANHMTEWKVRYD